MSTAKKAPVKAMKTLPDLNLAAVGLPADNAQSQDALDAMLSQAFSSRGAAVPTPESLTAPVVPARPLSDGGRLHDRP